MSPKIKKFLIDAKARVPPITMVIILIMVSLTAVFVWNPGMDKPVKAETVDQFSYYKEITLNSSQVPSTLSNFPVLINLSSDAELASKALATGNDIAFFDNTDTQLNHEIEKFDSGTGELVAWVNVTSLAHDADTTIKMYYNDSDIGSSAENVAGTWDSDFYNVYHMDSVSDTIGNDDGTNNGASIDDNSKVAGDNFDFELGDSDYFDLGADSHSNSMFDGGWTVSMWAKHESDTSRHDIYDDEVRIILSYNKNETDTENYRCYIRDTTASNIKLWSDATANLHKWHHVAVRYDGSVASFYINGKLQADGSIGTVDVEDDNDNWRLGSNEPADDHHHDGRIDEVRFTDDLDRGADWIKTEYNNINNATDGGFFTLGAEQGGPSTSASLDFTGTANSYFTTSGIVGGAYYANETGPTYETANLTVTISDTNVEYIRINVSDIDTNITANYINISFDDDNASWSGNWHSCTKGGETIIVNGSNWGSNNWMSGSNPFTADGDTDGYDEIQATTSIYFRVNVTYPSGIGTETYTKTDMTYDGGHYE